MESVYSLWLNQEYDYNLLGLFSTVERAQAAAQSFAQTRACPWTINEWTTNPDGTRWTASTAIEDITVFIRPMPIDLPPE